LLYVRLCLQSQNTKIAKSAIFFKTVGFYSGLGNPEEHNCTKSGDFVQLTPVADALADAGRQSQNLNIPKSAIS